MWIAGGGERASVRELYSFLQESVEKEKIDPVTGSSN